MKSLIALLALSSSLAALGSELATERPLVIVHGDVTVALEGFQRSEVKVFLSYAGLRFNQCGIRLASNAQGQPELQAFLADNLRIEDERGNDISTVDAAGDLVALLPFPQLDLYGRSHVVRTRGGETLAQLTEEVRSNFLHELTLTAQNLPCQR